LPEPSDPRERVRLEAGRVAMRLAALGPRRVPDDLLNHACADLAQLAWAAERLPGAPPPILVPKHGWPDVVKVLTGDLLAVPGEVGELAPAADRLTRLRRELP